MVLERTLESPLDCKEIQPVHREGNHFWIVIGRPDVEAETPIPWPTVVKNWPIGKDPDAGNDWRQGEKGMTEDEMVRWPHWHNRRESEWTLGVGDGQGGLACCDSWGRKESDRTEWLNLTKVGYAIQPSHPVLSPYPPTFSLSQHQCLFKWVSSLHQVSKVLEFQLQPKSFQWIFRADFLQDGLVGSPCSPRDSQDSFPTPQFKSINSSVPSFLYSPTLLAVWFQLEFLQ